MVELDGIGDVEREYPHSSLVVDCSFSLLLPKRSSLGARSNGPWGELARVDLLPEEWVQYTLLKNSLVMPGLMWFRPFLETSSFSELS